MLRTTIQISIEDIELMLDLMGQEHSSDSETKKHLRRRMQETLLYLRENNSNSDKA
jgi:hypothetical protein